MGLWDLFDFRVSVVSGYVPFLGFRVGLTEFSVQGLCPSWYQCFRGMCPLGIGGSRGM